MNKMKCIETKNIDNPTILTNVIYNNFLYLTEFPELLHNKKEIHKILTNNDKLFFLVYLDNKIIAYLIGDFRTFPDNRYGYYISYLYVLKKYRSKKIGSYLMNLLINKCSTIGVKFIILTCDTNDEKIVNFYKKLGFEIDPSLGGNKRHDVFSLFI